MDTNSTKFKVFDEQINQLTEGKCDPRATIDLSELIAGKEEAQILECKICYELAIYPMSCNLCDQIMCTDCLNQYA